MLEFGPNARQEFLATKKFYIGGTTPLPNKTAPLSSVPSACFSVGTKTFAPGSISLCSEGTSPTIGAFAGDGNFLFTALIGHVYGFCVHFLHLLGNGRVSHHAFGTEIPRIVALGEATQTIGKNYNFNAARNDPSGSGSVAVPIKVPFLISSIDDFTTARAAYLSFRLTGRPWA